MRTQTLRGPRVKVEQRIVLEAGSELVRIETRVDWHATHRMLRAEFRPTHFGAEAISEIQFGHIARPTTENDSVETAQFETCAHKWIAVQDADAGFALLNDSKYGHRAKNGLLSLNLLRSPTFPDRTADRGSHEFTYAFRPFAAGDLEPVIRDGYRLNNPLGIAPRASTFDSLVSSSNPGVIVETVKHAESGDGVVVRLYEALGRHDDRGAHHPHPAHRRARDRPARAAHRIRRPGRARVHAVRDQDPAAGDLMTSAPERTPDDRHERTPNARCRCAPSRSRSSPPASGRTWCSPR